MDNIAFSGISKLEISIVGSTKYNNLTMWWYVLSTLVLKRLGYLFAIYY